MCNVFTAPKGCIPVILDGIVCTTIHVLGNLSPAVAIAFMELNNLQFLFFSPRIFADVNIQMIVPPIGRSWGKRNASGKARGREGRAGGRGGGKEEEEGTGLQQRTPLPALFTIPAGQVGSKQFP